MTAPIVIVGAGLAGWTLARELRQKSPDVAIRLVCRDGGDFYSKPMLSNAFAQGKQAAQLVQNPATQQAAKFAVELIANTQVLSIDRGRHLLKTDRDDVTYSQLVLALGADPIRLPTPGMAHALSVNDWDDYNRFRKALSDAGEHARVAIIGGGLIGCEFANDLTTGGHRVQVLDPGSWPIGNLLSQESGRALQVALEKLGVQFHMGDVAESIEASTIGAGYRLQLRSGLMIEADVVLSAVGLRPRTSLAEQAQLTVSRGIHVDALGRTSDPCIWALGDCAAYASAARADIAQGAPRALPFVMPIMTAAKAMAMTLAGVETPIVFGSMPVRVKTPAMPLTVMA